MDRCPLCGQPTQERFNINKYGKKEWEKRSKRFRDVLMNIRSSIYVPSDSGQSALSEFLLKIKEVDDDKCIRKMNEFYELKIYRKGLGLAYLAKMILNFNENYETILNTEKKIYGSVKPARKINETE